MSDLGFSLFTTPVGACGIAWGAGGIVGVQLPEGSEGATRARLRQRFPEAQEGEPNEEARRAIEAVCALLDGRPSALDSVRLDLDGVPPFHRLVYEAARQIPPGATLSYGELAQELGSPRAARAVGQALRKNPFAIIVPCHRVLAAGGKVGGFTANGGVSTKLELLALERAPAPRVEPTARARSATTSMRRSAKSAPRSAAKSAPRSAVKSARSPAKSAAKTARSRVTPGAAPPPRAADTDSSAPAEAAASALAIATGAAAASAAREPQTFDFDPDAALQHLKAADKTLGRLIDKVGPFAMRKDGVSSLFLALAEAIVYQQLTGKAAATIFGRVKALLGADADGFSPAGVLALSDEALRGAGLSRNKLASLRDLATRAAQGELPSLAEASLLSDEALIERLTVVRGIGRWTVEMLLMFRLGRPDVLPVDDYGVRKGFAFAFKKPELPTRAELAARGARWAPYRSVASWYLWRAAALADAARSAARAKASAVSEKPAAARAKAAATRSTAPAKRAKTAATRSTAPAKRGKTAAARGKAPAARGKAPTLTRAGARRRKEP